jgi:hypothetical protein
MRSRKLAAHAADYRPRKFPCRQLATEVRRSRAGFDRLAHGAFDEVRSTAARRASGALIKPAHEKCRRELFGHLREPRFVYGHRWQAGDLLVWDNAATQHRATCDYALPQRRLMHRTATAGEEAVGTALA